jgi:hypothetical protein
VDDVGGDSKILLLVKRYYLLSFVSVLDTNPLSARTAHPKVPCLFCGGRIFYKDTLDQHYRDSVNHPFCIQCNAGFRDGAAYAEVNLLS